MKILVVDNMLVTFSTNSVPGGTERRNVSDAISFAREGHEVFLTVAMKAEDFRDNTEFEGVRLWRLHAEGKEQTSSTQRSWQKRVTERLDRYIERMGPPDVVHYGCNSFYWLAKHLMQKHGLPLNTQIGNYLSGNALYDVGRLRDLFLLKSLGAFFVANTQVCARKFESQIDKLRDSGALDGIKHDTSVKLFNHVNRNNAGVGFVGNPSNGKIRPDLGYAVIAARADPAKRVGAFCKVNFPLKVYLKYRSSTDKNGFFQKLVDRLKKNPNIQVFVDRPYQEIMDSMSGARLVVVSWPDETFGLTAFEAASFGVNVAVFRRNEDEDNATVEFLYEITKPKTFEYEDPAWKTKLDSLMEEPSSLKRREKMADACRQRYSYKDYVNERLSSLRRAIRLHSKVHR